MRPPTGEGYRGEGVQWKDVDSKDPEGGSYVILDEEHVYGPAVLGPIEQPTAGRADDVRGVYGEDVETKWALDGRRSRLVVGSPGMVGKYDRKFVGSV